MTKKGAVKTKRRRKDSGPPFDLFVSYRRKDSGPVLELVKELRADGLAVWMDQREIGDFASITDEIRAGLSASKAILVWYSAEYPRSRPCQMELTAGFIAAEQQGDPRERVLVINPEVTPGHIVPLQLADELYAPAARASALARKIGTQVRRLRGTLGARIPRQLPPQYGQKLVGASHFVNRVGDLWRVHSALAAPDSAIISGHHGPSVAQLCGLGGVGKSLLAEEYALRFAAAYPGGIFWLRAMGTGEGTPPDAEQRESSRLRQLRGMALAVGIEAMGLAPPQVESTLSVWLQKHGQRFLWIVDDLATGLPVDEVRRWLAPAPEGSTLITTRSREYESIQQALLLDVLPPDEAFRLLTSRRVPGDAAERTAAEGLCADLGFHPLALDVAGSALVSWTRSIAGFREALSAPTGDELELAAELASALPNGHERSIAATLLRSIYSLPEEGRDFLRLASSVATAPVPIRLIEAVFQVLDNLPKDAARIRAMRALSQCAKASLVDGLAEAPRSVHALVSRTVRLYDSAPARRGAVREAAIRVLDAILPAVADVRTHRDLELEVAHARHLVAAPPADPESLDLLGWVARHDVERADFASAEVLSRRRMEACEVAHGASDEKTLLAAGDLERALAGGRKFGEALRLAERVLAGRRALLGPDHLDTLTAMNNLAIVRSALGDEKGALELQKEVLATRRRLLGPEHEHTLYALHNYASTLASSGNPAAAVPLLEEAYRVRTKVLGRDHLSTLISRVGLGATLYEVGRRDEACLHLREVSGTFEHLFGSDNERTLQAKVSLGRVLIGMGVPLQAVHLLAPLVAVATEKLGRDHETTHLAMNNLAKALLDLGRPSEARPLCELAWRGRQRTVGINEDWLGARFGLNLVEACLKNGDQATAAEVLTELDWLRQLNPGALTGGRRADRQRLDELAALLGAPA